MNLLKPYSNGNFVVCLRDYCFEEIMSEISSDIVKFYLINNQYLYVLNEDEPLNGFVVRAIKVSNDISYRLLAEGDDVMSRIHKM
ncbi:hypothetical protein PRBRB14_21860 [Hallella multisaccharivorax DSM 17128]|uniref:Uncharacterized protein n=1 Tax=Hallella multisaccharivorax DSM 17128 TaxID=688246 RepID=F8N7J1_9BACT|nr:hypothetical protein Premu_2057 [Hallella multisaccharivorax DSM 17128]GJG31307.1 hypothetical protein PRBRB14_21860 [Hallella multisaccharivorax DSM 17128]